MQKYIPLILVTVLTNALAQMLLKKGMLMVGQFQLSPELAPTLLTRVLLNPFVVAGLLIMVVSMGMHLTVLSRVEVSFAYPFLSVSYIVVLFAGYFFFAEQLSASRVLGVALICVGTYFIARS